MFLDDGGQLGGVEHEEQRAEDRTLRNARCQLNVRRFFAPVNHLLCPISQEGRDPTVGCSVDAKGSEEALEQQVMVDGVERGAKIQQSQERDSDQVVR